jgi:hypothetical protein
MANNLRRRINLNPLGPKNLIPSSSALGPVNPVQGNQIQGASATTVTVTLPNGITEGNLVIATVTFGGNDETTITGPAGWSSDVINKPGGTNAITAAIFSLLVDAGHAGQTSFQFTADTSHTWYVTITEWNSQTGWQATPLDQTAVGQTGTSAATVIVSGTTAATAQDNELQVANLAYKGSEQPESSITVNWNRDREVTLAANNTSTELFNKQNAAGTASCQYTIGSAQFWAGAIATYKPAITGGGDATVSPVAISALTSIPVPAIIAESVIAVSVVSGTTAIPVPGIAAGAGIIASVVLGAVSVPVPAIPAGPAVIQAQATIPVPGILAGSVATPAMVLAAASIPVPGIVAGSTVTAAVVASITTIPVPSVSAGGSATVNAVVVSAVASIPVPGIIASSIINAAVVLGGYSVPVPGKIAGSTIVVTRVLAQAAVPVPGIVAGVTIPVTVIQGNTSIPGNLVRISSLIQPNVIAGVVTIAVPPIVAGSIISANAVFTQAQIPVSAILTISAIVFGNSHMAGADTARSHVAGEEQEELSLVVFSDIDSHIIGGVGPTSHAVEGEGAHGN